MGGLDEDYLLRTGSVVIEDEWKKRLNSTDDVRANEARVNGPWDFPQENHVVILLVSPSVVQIDHCMHHICISPTL